MAEIDDFLNFGEECEFAKEYENINRAEGSPSSEDAELSISASVSADFDMCEYTISASLGSWDGVSDDFSHLKVKSPTTAISALKTRVSDEMASIDPSTFTTSIAENKDLVETPRKRRASETKKGKEVIAHQRSASVPSVQGNTELDASGDPIIAKRQDRLMRNRAAALASRERKREHVMRLETTIFDIEVERDELQCVMFRMSGEIKRLKDVLLSHGIHDISEEIAIPELRMRRDSSEVLEEIRSKAGPTGFSPRGALKKEQILANQVAAEEHLRNVTMRQQAMNAKGEEKKVPNIIMILIFGIALFASIPTSTLMSWTSDRNHILFNFPDSMISIPPETAISQLRNQGFMVADEMKEQGLGQYLPADLSSTPKETFKLLTRESDSWTPLKS